ncbi:MAG: VOC family protein [Roseiflexaceae bacterium]|jgi:catechol 2,3-dioxygenase-like lactoylglutathione lyase family enzyme
MITSIHHVSIQVKDIAYAVRFYLALGLPVIPLSPAYAFVMTPNAGILLRHVPQAVPSQTDVHALGWRHLCIQVPDMNRALGICENHAVTMLSSPVDLRTGHLYIYGRNPDATLIEIEEVPYTPYHYPCWLGHIACVSHDVAQLKRFYVDFIGGDIVDPGPIGPNAAYDRVVGFSQTRLHPVWVKRLNLTIELWQFVHPVSPARIQSTTAMAGYQSVGFVSDDIESDIHRCIHLGGTLISTSTTHAQVTDCDMNYFDIYSANHPLIMTHSPLLHPSLLTENAAHWRPRSQQS